MLSIGDVINGGYNKQEAGKGGEGGKGRTTVGPWDGGILFCGVKIGQGSRYRVEGPPKCSVSVLYKGRHWKESGTPSSSNYRGEEAQRSGVSQGLG